MFTLRTVFNDKSKRNNYLGNDYEVFFKNLEAKVGEKDEEFNGYLRELFPPNTVVDESYDGIFAIINNGSKLIPLYRGVSYYVITEKGKTFENLTFKNIENESR